MQGNYFGRNMPGRFGIRIENRVITEYDKIPTERVNRSRTGWLGILIGNPLFVFLVGKAEADFSADRR